MATPATTSTAAPSSSSPSHWASKYRGATVEDLDPPPALSTSPQASISQALQSAFERDYTHLTVVSTTDRALLGYISTPRLQNQLRSGEVRETDTVEQAMVRFRRKGRRYRMITMQTTLEELERFFEGEGGEGKEEGSIGGGGGGGGEGGHGENKETTQKAGQQDFAVVTDPARRFVLGVATREDLRKFVERRPF